MPTSIVDPRLPDPSGFDDCADANHEVWPAAAHSQSGQCACDRGLRSVAGSTPVDRRHRSIPVEARGRFAVPGAYFQRFSCPPFVAVSLLIIPVSMILDREHATHGVTPAGILCFVLGWIVFCGLALLAGGLLTQLLVSRRSTSRT